MNEWDGTERRAPNVIAEALAARPRNTVEAPVVVVLVGFAATLLMLAVSIYSHGLIIQHQRQLMESTRQFACYIVHTSQGEPPNQALSACGFITLGGVKP
jgi:hypothetical protein